MDDEYNNEVVRQRVMGMVLKEVNRDSLSRQAGGKTGRLRICSVAAVAASVGLVAGGAFVDMLDDELVVVRIGSGWHGQTGTRPVTNRTPAVFKQASAVLKPA